MSATIRSGDRVEIVGPLIGAVLHAAPKDLVAVRLDPIEGSSRQLLAVPLGYVKRLAPTLLVEVGSAVWASTLHQPVRRAWVRIDQSDRPWIGAATDGGARWATDADLIDPVPVTPEEAR